MKKVFTTGQVAKICKVAPGRCPSGLIRVDSKATGFRAARINASPANNSFGSSRNMECRLGSWKRKSGTKSS